MTLVIMAAGMGSRFGGLKQIEPIDKDGNFIIDYSIYDAIREGFDKVVFVIKEENYDIFRETVGKRIEGRIKVEYAFQKIDDIPEGYSVPEGREKPWGTGQAILCTKDYVDDVIEAYPRAGQTELSSTWLSIDSAGESVITPESGKIYILMAASTTYNIYSQFRHSGTAYVKLNDGGISPISNNELDTICV